MNHFTRRASVLMAAAAVVVIGGAALVACNASDESAPVVPGGPTGSDPAAEGFTYYSTKFVVPFTVTLPSWLKGHSSPAAINPTTMAWLTACTGNQDDCWDRQRAISLVSPLAIQRPGTAGPQPVPNYEGYLAFLDSLETTSGLASTERTTTSVDGRHTTVMTLTPSRIPDGEGLLCAQVGDHEFCWFPDDVGRPVRFAVVNTGTTPLIIYMIPTTDDAPNWPTLTQDFNTMLSTVRLGATPLPSGS